VLGEILSEENISLDTPGVPPLLTTMVPMVIVSELGTSGVVHVGLKTPAVMFVNEELYNPAIQI